MLSYNRRNVQRLSIIIVGVGLLNSLACAGFPKFEYHQIARIGNEHVYLRNILKEQSGN